MRKTRWNICLACVLLVTGLTTVWLYGMRARLFSDIQIKKTEDVWVASGPIEYGLSCPWTRPILSGNRLIIVEKQKRKFYIKGFSITRLGMCFSRDDYFVTAFQLFGGHRVYRTNIRVRKNPLQILGIWPWGENVVVCGYCQEEPCLENRIFYITILNGKGRVLNQFPIHAHEFPIHTYPMAVDERNNLLICRGLRILQLPSGTEKLTVNLEYCIHMATDKDGNVYVNRLNQRDDNWADYVYKRVPNVSGHIEKYSTVPWKKLWSVEVTPEKGYAWLLKYEDNMLWYAVCDERMGGTIEGRTKWIGGPLDAETGERVETDRTCDPYRIETEFDGRQYVVTKKDDDLHVRIIPLKETEQP